MKKVNIYEAKTRLSSSSRRPRPGATCHARPDGPGRLTGSRGRGASGAWNPRRTVPIPTTSTAPAGRCPARLRGRVMRLLVDTHLSVGRGEEPSPAEGGRLLLEEPRTRSSSARRASGRSDQGGAAQARLQGDVTLLRPALARWLRRASGLRHPRREAREPTAIHKDPFDRMLVAQSSPSLSSSSRTTGARRLRRRREGRLATSERITSTIDSPVAAVRLSRVTSGCSRFGG